MSSARTTLRARLSVSTALVGGVIGIATWAPAAAQLPTGGSTSPGAPPVGIVPDGTNKLNVNLGTNARSIVTWNSYSIGTGNTVNYNYGRATPGAVLNRVTGVTASAINGNITVNDVLTGPTAPLSVYLINPNGITFGTGANVNVGALIASTLDQNVASDALFLLSTGQLGRLTGTSGFVAVAGNARLTGTTGEVVLIGAAVDPAGAAAGQTGGAVRTEAGTTITAASDAAFIVGSDVTIARTPGSPLAFTINAGTAVSANLVSAGTIGGRNVAFALASRATFTDALLVSGAVTATTVSATDRGIVLAAGVTSPVVDAGDTPAVTVRTFLGDTAGAATLAQTGGTLTATGAAGSVLAGSKGTAALAGGVTAGNAFTVAGAGVALGGAGATAQSAAGAVAITSSAEITGTAGLTLTANSDGTTAAAVPGVVTDQAINLRTTAAGSAIDFALGSALNGGTAAQRTDIAVIQANPASTLGFGDITANAFTSSSNGGAIVVQGATRGSALRFGTVALDSVFRVTGTGASGSVSVAAATIGGAGQDLTLSATEATVTAPGTLRASGSVAVTADGGLTLSQLGADGGSVLARSLSGGVSVTQLDAVTGATVDAQAGNATVTGPVSVTGTTGGYSVTGDAVVLGDSGGAAVTQAAGGAVAVTARGGGGITGRAGLTLTANSDNTPAEAGTSLGLATAATGAPIAFAVNTTLNGGTTAAGGTLISVSQAGDTSTLALGNIRARTFISTVSGPGVSETSGGATRDSALRFGDVTLDEGSFVVTSNASDVTVGSIVLGGAENAIELSAVAGTVTAPSSLSAPGGVSVIARDSLTLSTLTASAGAVIVNATAGDATVTGGVSAGGGDYTVTGASVSLGTTGAAVTQVASGAVTLTARTGGITGREQLTVRSGTGVGNPLTLRTQAANQAISFAASSTLAGGSAGDAADVRLIAADFDGALQLGTVFGRALQSQTGAGPLAAGVTRTGTITTGDVTLLGAPLNLLSTGGGIATGSITVSAPGTTALVAQGGAIQTGVTLAAFGSVLFDASTAVTAGDISAIDVALNARGGTLGVSSITARDDIALRSTTAITASPGATWTSGATVSGQAATDVNADADTLVGATLAGNDIDVAAATIRIAATRAIGSGSDVRLTGTIGQPAPTDDFLSVADGDVVLTSAVTARDIAIQAGGAVTAGALTANDDVAVRAGARGLSLGAVIAGAPAAVDVAGAADLLLPGVSFTGNDIDLAASGLLAFGLLDAGGDIRVASSGSGDVRIGLPTADLGLTAGGDIALTGLAAGRDIALSAGGSIAAGDLSALDDIVLRAGATITTATQAAGATIAGNVPVDTDATGAADVLRGTGLIVGRDVDNRAAALTVTRARAIGANSDVALTALSGPLQLGEADAGSDLQVTAEGTVEVAGPVTAGGSYRVTGASVLLGSGVPGAVRQQAAGLVRIVATAGAITGAGELTLVANQNDTAAGAESLVLDATGGDIAFGAGTTLLGGATNQASDISVRLGTAGAGLTLGTVRARSLRETDAVGTAFGSLNTDGAVSFLGDVSVLAGLEITAAGALATRAVTVAGFAGAPQPLVLRGASITAAGTLAAQGNVTLVATAGNLALTTASGLLGAVSYGGNVVLNASGGATGNGVQAAGDITATVGGADTIAFADAGIAGTLLNRADPNPSASVPPPGTDPLPSTLPTAGAGDVSITAGSISKVRVTAVRDAALQANAGDLSLATVAAGDDIAIRVSGAVTGTSWTSGIAVNGVAPVDQPGVADVLAGIAQPGKDIDVRGASVTIAAASAVGAGSDVRIAGAVSGVTPDGDLAIGAGGDIALTGAASARDIALNAGGAIATAALDARDDIALRAGGGIATGALTAGTGPVDVAGAADALLGAGVDLTGNDIDVAGGSLLASAATANGGGGDLRLVATAGRLELGSGSAGAAVLLDKRGETDELVVSGTLTGGTAAPTGNVTLRSATALRLNTVVSQTGSINVDLNDPVDPLAPPSGELTGIGGAGAIFRALDPNGDIFVEVGPRVEIADASAGRDLVVTAVSRPGAGVGILDIFNGVAGRDLVLIGAGPVEVRARTLVAGDDIGVRAGLSATGLDWRTGTRDEDGAADAALFGVDFTGSDIDAAAGGITLGTAHAAGTQSDVRLAGAGGGLSVGPGRIIGGTPDGDLDITAGGAILLDGFATARDVALRVGGVLHTGAISARDDIALRAGGGLATGDLASGAAVQGVTPVDVTGVADALLPGISLAGNDIDVAAAAITMNAAVALGAGSDVRLRGPVSSSGDGANDLVIQAGGGIDLGAPVIGRDVALLAAGAVSAATVTARDDIAIRAGGAIAVQALTSGATIGALGAVDVAGAADALPGTALPGNDIDAQGASFVASTAIANGTGSDLRLTTTNGALQLGTASAGSNVTLAVGGNLRVTGGLNATGGTLSVTAASASDPAAGGLGVASATAGQAMTLNATAGSFQLTSASAGTTFELNAATEAVIGNPAAAGTGGVTVGGGGRTAANGAVIRANEVDLAGGLTAGTVLLVNRSPAGSATATMNLGDFAAAPGGFDLSAAEVNRIAAPQIAIAQTFGGAARATRLGTLPLAATTGAARIDLLTTGRVDLVGTLGEASGAASAGRVVRLGGTNSGTALIAGAAAIGTPVDDSRAALLVAIATPTAGGRILFTGTSTVDLRADRVAFGQTAGFLDALSLSGSGTGIDFAQVATRFISDPASSLYNSANPIGDFSRAYADASSTLLTASTLTVRYGDYALFQNTAQPTQPNPNSGVTVGSFLGLTAQGTAAGQSGANGLALFGVINNLTGSSAALQGQNVVETNNLNPANSRINGCLVGSGGGGCLISTVITPVLNVFDEPRATIFRTAADLAVQFDPVVSTNNESLFSDLGTIDFQFDEQKCDPASNATCPNDGVTDQ